MPDEVPASSTKSWSPSPRSFWIHWRVTVFVLVFLIGFSSQLFRTLGFEYSVISSVVLSLILGSFWVWNSSTVHSWKSSKSILLQSVILALTPLFLSLLSAFYIPNCALWDGIELYAAIAFPGAIIGGIYGVVAVRLVKRRSRRVALFSLWWFTSLFFSFLPGYFNPQIFTYGWQYGYFPGIGWDSAIELSDKYTFSRIDEIAVALAMLGAVHVWKRRQGWNSRILSTKLFALALLTTAIVITVLDQDLVVESSHAHVDALLNSTIRDSLESEKFEVHYESSSFSKESQEVLREDVGWYLHSIGRRLHLAPLSRPINIYVYPNPDTMNEYVGTGAASITKPWLAEVHLSKQNLTSLEHELTHVLMSDEGSLPFAISRSTGLTEGVAMAMQRSYDGLHTLDELASDIIEARFATGVSGVMSFWGFASNASQKSYVLVGSFVKYLLKHYGPAAFVRAYSSCNYEREYHKSLATLEQEWKKSLPSETTMPHDDFLRTYYEFGGSSIIYSPCLRRLGKLERRAKKAYQLRQYGIADSMYNIVLEESGSLSALSGRAYCYIQMGKYAAAVKLFDSSVTVDAMKAEVGLSYLKAICEFLAQDTTAALHDLKRVVKLRLDRSLTLSAYALEKLLPVRLKDTASSRHVNLRSYLELTMKDASPGAGFLTVIEQEMPADSLQPYLEYLIARGFREKGRESEAAEYFEKARTLKCYTSEDSLLVFESTMRLMRIRKIILPVAPPSFMREAAEEEYADLFAEINYFWQLQNPELKDL